MLDRESAPVDGLSESAGLTRAVEKLQRHLVGEARSHRRTWTEIGDALGGSRQVARERFARPPD